MRENTHTQTRPTPGRVDAAQARELLDTHNALLVDVRTPNEYRSGHIDGATNIPLQALSARAGELRDEDRPIVVYCRSGSRSNSALQLLRASGLEDVYDLGAMSNW